MKNFVSCFCNQLDLKEDMIIQKASIHNAERARELSDISSQAPDSIAGAPIYIAFAAAGEKKLMKEIQIIADVMKSIIRKIYKIILTQTSELFLLNFLMSVHRRICRPRKRTN